MDQPTAVSLAPPTRPVVAAGALRNIRALPALFALITLAFGLIYLAVIPPWGGPDETRHFEYVRLLNEKGRLVGYGDIDPHVMDEIIRSMDAVNYWQWGISIWKRTHPGELPPDFTAIYGEGAHELHQPPLAYLLYLGPYKWFANGTITSQLYAMRLLSILLDIVVVLAAYAAGRELFPDDVTLALALPVFIMLLPQHLFLHSTVMNDHLVEATLAWILVLVARAIRRGLSMPLAIGIVVLLAIGLGAKRSALFAVPILGVALLAYMYVHWGGGRLSGAQQRIRIGLVVLALFLGALAAAVTWNWISINQPALRDYILHIFFFLPSEQFPFQLDARVVSPAAFALYISYLKYTFISTWGHFGWMNITLGVRAYIGFAILSAVALLGLVLYFVRDFPKLEQSRRATLVVYMAGVVVGLLVIIGLEVRFWDLGWGGDPQGRYLFPLLIPLATLLLLGLRAWFPRTRYLLWFALLVGGMVVYNIVVLVFFIVPFYRA